MSLCVMWSFSTGKVESFKGPKGSSELAEEI